jgi:hypothetical protein
MGIAFHAGLRATIARPMINLAMAILIEDLDVVSLLRDLPDEGLERGQSGTVVLTHGHREAFEVEFVLRPDSVGGSVVATVRAEDLVKLRGLNRAPPSTDG